MTIEKDQQPVMKTVVKTTYSPVLRRSMVNLYLLGIEQVRLDNFKGATKEFLNMLYAGRGKSISYTILENIEKNKDELIVELMKQYGIDKDEDCYNLYFDELSKYFKEHLTMISGLAFNNMFDKLAMLSSADADQRIH